MQKVMMRWQAASLFGWGILGWNLFEHWAAGTAIQPLMGVRLHPGDVPGINPVRLAAVQSTLDASNRFLESLEEGKINMKDQQVLVIDAFGNSLAPALGRTGPLGVRNVARCIFESTQLGSAGTIEPYDTVLCASEWSANLLRGVTDKPVAMIHEGIDHSLFFPGPRSGVLDPDCFYIFTGGKVEFRKAQDLVLFAFREFAARHDDVVLVAAWNSPWPDMSAGYQANLPAPLRKNEHGALDIRRWVIENGIPSHQFIDLPLTPNGALPAILREMDCSLQVSRCEACTNLPAKEAMACGVPVILANNTGTRDLIDVDNCIALTTQDPVAGPPGVGTDGWGESRVEEIVEALETLYTDTQKRKRIGVRGAQWILEKRRTWRDHAADLSTYLQTLA